MNNLLEQRDSDMIKRVKFKKKMDGLINLSANNSDARLLDEGAVVEGEDMVRFFIKKGTMQKFFNGENEYLPNIDDDYKGYINIGHTNFCQDPTCLIGEWTKNDLSLVEIGDERQGIDVNIRLWDWHPTVQLLHKLPYSVGISAEFYAHTDNELSESMGMSVYDEVLITDFAVVGNGANVNSNGISLNTEGTDMKKNEVVEKLQNALNEMNAPEPEEPIEGAEVPTEEPETPVEDESEGEGTLDEGEESDEAPDNEGEDSEGVLDEALSAIERLREENAELKAENESLKASISKFTAKFQTLSVAINPSLKEEPTKVEEESFDRYGGYTDGIGKE